MAEVKKNNTGDSNTGDRNTGYWNTGDSNNGDWNTGSSNIGNWNTGDRNTGDWNTGDRNTGYSNTGSSNIGHRNTGDRNTGDRNTGNSNIGDRNTGDWNTGSSNTGYFNTITPDEIMVFNKPFSREEFNNIEKPDFLCFDLCHWVGESDMTDEEKANDPDFHIRGGQLQSMEYKEAFRKSWDCAPIEDRKKVLNLPNFDNDIFKEISGIDVLAELDEKKVTIEVTQKQLNKIKILGVI